MIPAYTQDNTTYACTTPLGPEALLLVGFSGEEAISTPYRFDLDLRATDDTVAATALVGQPATIALGLEDGTIRYISGIVTRVVQAGVFADFTVYRAELRPWFWLLTLTSDCKIFQNMTVPQILVQLFTGLGFADYRVALTGVYAPREYCVQYRETAFDFASRLMEDCGIFYFFEHTADAHILVLADGPQAFVPSAGLTTLGFADADQAPRAGDVLITCEVETAVTSTGYASTDYNFEFPATSLYAALPGLTPAGSIYTYPGGQALLAEGEAIARLRVEAFEAGAQSLRGRGYCRALQSGFSFTLAGHPNPAVDGIYVVRRVVHHARPDVYESELEAFPTAVPFRPPLRTRRPVIAGTQTAVVVGTPGAEIWTDEYGRIKVQFHWDRLGTLDENSSCWIRVAQGWAGKAYGSIFIPRIGQEVVISFLDGDPDRPLITGAVYNALQPVPYALPALQAQSGIKTSSTLGGAGSNELRFDDTTGAEELYMHAQFNMTTQVEQDRTTTIVTGNDALTVATGNRTITVATGTETHTVQGTRTLTVNSAEVHNNLTDFTHIVTGNYTLQVTGNLLLSAAGTVTIQSGQAMTLDSAMAATFSAAADLSASAGMTLTTSAGLSAIHDAGVDLNLAGGATTTVTGGALVAVTGGLITLNG